MDARDLERRRYMEDGVTDYRSMFDREYIGAWDLQGRDLVVEISRVEAGTLTGSGGRKNKKPIVHFKGKERGLALNKTNAKTIATLYGNDTTQWIGKRITIYPTTTTFGSEQMDCIRVRPTKPQVRGGKPTEAPADPGARDPGAEG